MVVFKLVTFTIEVQMLGVADTRDMKAKAPENTSFVSTDFGEGEAVAAVTISRGNTAVGKKRCLQGTSGEDRTGKVSVVLRHNV